MPKEVFGLPVNIIVTFKRVPLVPISGISHKKFGFYQIEFYKAEDVTLRVGIMKNSQWTLFFYWYLALFFVDNTIIYFGCICFQSITPLSLLI